MRGVGVLPPVVSECVPLRAQAFGDWDGCAGRWMCEEMEMGEMEASVHLLGIVPETVPSESR